MRQKVLIVDDSKLIVQMVRSLLKSLDVETFVAYSGTTGIAMAVAHQPDVILLDVEMPELDGIEVCRRLKADPATSIIPVIFLTAQATTEEKVRGLNVGAFDYVAKPFEPAEMRARVQVSLRIKYLLDLLAQKAMIDGLTGLWNRAYFDQKVAALAVETTGAMPYACIMVDVDHFKELNDTYGHPFGDHVLKCLSQQLLDGCRSEDVVCRFGGEEFAMLLPGATSIDANAVAERLRQSIATRLVTYGEHQATITCSFGVASTRDLAGSTLVGLADEALYEAKHAGRNRVVQAIVDAASAQLTSV